MALGRGSIVLVFTAVSVVTAGCGAGAGSRSSAPDERADMRVHGRTAPPPASSRARRSTTSIAATTDGLVAMTSDASALSSTVLRRQTPQQDYMLVAGFTVDEWIVRLAAFPSRYPDHVGIGLRSPRVRAQVYGECVVRVMADGDMLLAPEPESVQVRPGTTGGYYETLNVIVPRTELATMATADRLVVRVCDTELRLGPEHRAVIAEMLLRIDEEQRWIAADAAAHPPVQDLTPPAEESGAAP